MTASVVQEAIYAFWAERDRRVSRRVDLGELRPITHGGYLAPAIAAVVQALIKHGIEPTSILTDQPFQLPGSYRLSPRRYDLVVLDDDVLVAAVDFRCQVGPSFGNNFNNRVDEIVSLGADHSRAHADNIVSPFKPCLGTFFVLEECDRSTTPIRRRATGLASADDQTRDLSYQDSYSLIFQRLLDDRMYDAVCYLTTRKPPDFSVSEPFEGMSFSNFVRTIVGRVEEIRAVRRSSENGPLVLGRRLAQRSDVDEVLSGITSTPTGLSAAESAVIRQRRHVVSTLQGLALDPAVGEAQMQKEIGERYWLFGGHYIGVANRRTLVPLDQFDIPLICADGSLHIVELKGPESKLVKWHRNHLIVANEVHEAVSQCQNYLRSLDEMGSSLRTLYHNELGLNYDYRRAKGTVVVGHPARVEIDGVTREQIEQTIRSYNAHLSRIQVVTYADLLDAADRALKFEGERPTR